MAGVLSRWSVRLEKRLLRAVWLKSHGNSRRDPTVERPDITLQAAQLDAMAQELTAQRTATAQTGVRAGLSLADTKLLTKPHGYSGEHDGKERWTTWSFKMRAYCAAMAPRLGELMGTGSAQDVEIRQDALTPSDAAHSTNLYHILSLLTDAEALDIVQNSPLSNGLEVWRRMVTRWEPKVPARFRGMLQAIPFPEWDIPGSDVTQLSAAWEKQAQDYEQQSGDKISGAIKLGVVLHHLPDASLREHLLLNSRVYDTYALMSAEVRAVATAKTTWSGPTPVDLSILAKEAVCHVCGQKGHFAKDCWHHRAATKGVGKERKARKAKGKAQNPRMVTPSRKVLAMTVARTVTLHANVRRRKKQAMQVPVVEVVYIA